MTIKLYFSPAACSLGPHLALEEAGAKFEVQRVDLAKGEQRGADYLRVNPKGRVPTLVDGDFVLTECPAILRYVALRPPASGLWPSEPREEARCAEWLAWLSSTIHVAYAHVRRADRYASDPRALEDVVATGRKNVHALWNAVDERLGQGPFALGERFSVADPYLLVFWMWGRRPEIGFDTTKDLPNWTAHARRMLARPAVGKVFAREGLEVPRS